MTRYAILTTVLLVAAHAACSPAPAEPVSPEASAPETTSSASARIEVPASVRSNLGIRFAEVELRHVERTLRVPGAFELQPLARHEYRMALPGRVQLLVDQFEAVEPGQVLFRFHSPAWPELAHEILMAEQSIGSARATIDVKQARLVEARRELELLHERLAALAQAEFKRADLEVEAARLEAGLPRLAAELALARTQLANAESTREHALHRAATAAGIDESALDAEVVVEGETRPAYRTVDWIDVRATEPGVIEHLAVTDGSFVEPPGLVLSTVDPSLVRFRALGLQADLPLLLDRAEARIVPPNTPGLPVDGALSATLGLGLEAHPQERTVTLLATPTEHAPWVRAGVSAFLEVVTETTARPSLAVPSAAVVRDGLTHVLFRRDPNDPGSVIRIEADLGVDDGRWVELKSGVMRGDQVVLDGAYELKLASQQAGGAPSGGHVHADGSVHEAH
jgi:membrane fusion protein (multidrug efflux system)